MGKKIKSQRFSDRDVEEFEHNLRAEIELLKQWFLERNFADDHPLEVGFELEFHLLNKGLCVEPAYAEYIKSMSDDFVVSEFGKSMLEINSRHFGFYENALTKCKNHLDHLWDKCVVHAESLGLNALSIGIVPTGRRQDFVGSTVTDEARCLALNERLAILRNRCAIQLDLQGREHLHTECRSLALLGSACALQIQVQINLSKALRFYNASQVIAAPVLAIGCNTPFFLGKSLWDETRLPLFEKLFAMEGRQYRKILPNVTFGGGYVKNSLLELFLENFAAYLRLLPEPNDGPIEEMWHVRLHNSTVYRWSRPVIGFDEKTNKPHLRIEFRALPAGTSIVDMIAISAFYLGLLQAYGTAETAPEHRLPFASAKANFYRAARFGIDAKLTWFDDQECSVSELMLNELIPMAYQGLVTLGIDADDAKVYIDIIEQRIRKHMTGSLWQREFYRRNGEDFKLLTSAYLEMQRSGLPVHTWPLE